MCLCEVALNIELDGVGCVRHDGQSSERIHYRGSREESQRTRVMTSTRKGTHRTTENLEMNLIVSSNQER